MKFFYQLFFIFLLFSGQAFASEDPIITNEEPKITNPFLWKATKNNQTIYLFGTIHKYINIEELPDEVFSYIDSSEIFFTENGKSRIDSEILDVQMGRYASEAELKLLALDSFDWFDESIIAVVRIPFTLVYILNRENIEEAWLKLAEEYRLGDESNFGDDKFPKSVEYFLATKRHNAWMPKILEQSKEGQTFVAAGIAHFLYPEDNILDRLREEGFEVERVKMKQPITHEKQNDVHVIVFG